MSQSKMIWKRLVVIVSIAFLSVVFYVMINRMKQQRFVAERYERDGVRRRDAEDQ